jgi:iron complex outermembrane receptor protein
MRVTCVAVALCLSVLGLAASPNVDASIRKPTNIPAQELGTALRALEKDRNLQVIFVSEDVRNVRTQGAVGEFTSDEALQALLKGTGLTFRYLDDKTVTIVPLAEQSSTPATDAQLPVAPPASKPSDPDKVKPTAGAGESKKSFWNRFRLAQADQGTSSGPSPVERKDDQSSNKKKADQLEEIVVTGSRIPTAEGQQVVPVRSYTRDDIVISGQTTVADFLNTLPDVSISSSEVNSPGLPGQTTVQLHGLPVGTTLVLLDSHRVESSYNGFFDLNNIPTSAIERIEVLPVGASSIYGADALGGVVNFVLRDNFDGFEANATFGHEAGANDSGADLAWGNTWGKGSISLIGTFQERGLLVGSQREATSTIDFPPNAPTFNYVLDLCGNVYSVDGHNLPGLSATQAGIPPGLSGTPTTQEFGATAGKLNLCNIDRFNFLIPHTKREGAVLSGHYEFANWADVFTEVMLSHETLEAPTFPLIYAYQSALPANNPFNPFGKAVAVSFAYPGILQTAGNSGSLIRPLIGVRGSLFSDWHYEATAYISHDQFQEDTPGDVDSVFSSSSPVQTALNSSDPATALNPFVTGAPGTPQLLQSLVSQAQAGQVQYHLDDEIVDGQGVLRGPLLKLPAGSLDAVIGSEYSHEKQSTTGLTSAPLDLQRTSNAAFAEARVPLLADPGYQKAGPRLALILGGRFDHTSDFGGKATWQGGLQWRPTETLSFHGSYGVSYKAPELQQIGGSPMSFPGSNPFLVDPYRGNQLVPPITLESGPNPNLKPETGTSHTLGITYSSLALPGFSASLTNFTVDISQYIGQPSLEALVDNPKLYPGAVIRGPTTPQDQQLGYLGQILQVNELFFNFGDLHVAGVDADLRYVIDTRVGQFTPSLQVSNIYKWQSALVPGAPLISYVGQANDNPGFAPHWKGTAALAWQQGPLSARLAGRYIGPYKDYQVYVPNTNELGNSWIFDMNIRFEVGELLAGGDHWLAKSYVALSAVNLFNKAPPFSYGTLPWAYNEYDIRGRFLSAKVGIKW